MLFNVLSNWGTVASVGVTHYTAAFPAESAALLAWFKLQDVLGPQVSCKRRAKFVPHLLRWLFIVLVNVARLIAPDF